MPIQLPNLDDRTYADLVDEARRLIPADWTNHNPSDPGITLVELLAYLAEMLLYRLNRVTEENQRRFLQLLNGPDWQSTPGGLSEDIRATVQALRSRFRAVTPEDYEALVLEDFSKWLRSFLAASGPEDLNEWWTVTGFDAQRPEQRPASVFPLVDIDVDGKTISQQMFLRRALGVPRRYLDTSSEAERRAPRPGHMSLIVVPYPDASGDLQPTLLQRKAVSAYLEPRRILTTRLHVVGPCYAPVEGELVIARTEDVRTEELTARVIAELQRFTDVFVGGGEGDGWPFGKDVFVSDVHAVLEGIQGVDHITDVMLASVCTPGDAYCVAADPVWHDNGDLVGLSLGENLLPVLRLRPEAIVIGPADAFIPVDVVISIRAKATSDPALLRQAIKNTVRQFFHPLHGGHVDQGDRPLERSAADLRAAVAAIAGVQSVDLLELQTVAGTVPLMQVLPGEVVDWRVQIGLTQ